MIDMEQEIELEWNNANRKWFVNKGYKFTNWGDTLIVKAKDLREQSTYKIKFICDYCGKECIQTLRVYNEGHNKYPKDACQHCGTVKAREIDLNKRTEKMKNQVLKQSEIKGYKIVFDWNNYKNQSSRIKYVCPKHGMFEMSCANFVKGYGCPKCGDESCSTKKKLSKEDVIDIIESIDNNKLLNPQDYKGNGKCNLLVRCSCGNTFYTSIGKYNKKYRCSKCAKSESVGENKIKHFLEEHNIPYISQYKYEDCKDKRPLPFDFKLLDRELCIEFDGIHHYKPVRGEKQLHYIQSHDNIKTNYCINNNIKLLRIKYDEWINIDKILTKELLIT